MIALIFIVGIFLFVFIRDNRENIGENDNTPLEAPSLPSDIKIPNNQEIDISNFENANREIKKQELTGTWILEYEDTIGERYPQEGISLTFTENNYEKNINGEVTKGTYQLENNQVTFSENNKVFINIKNNKLILVYPEYPKAEVYRKLG